MTPFQEAQQEALAARMAIDALEGEQKKDEQTLADMRTSFVAAEQNLTDQISRRRETIATARQALQSALQRQNDAPLYTPEATPGEETPGFRLDAAHANCDEFTRIGDGLAVQHVPGDGLEESGHA